MTFNTFLIRSTFRNKKRSFLTIISVSFSLLLLTLMAALWRTFYGNQSSSTAANGVIIRDRVSLAFLLPVYYRDKIRSVPGVRSVVPITWFGGRYIDDRPEHFFAQFATDPEEYLRVAPEELVSEDQVSAWQKDRAGALVDITLASKFGWKLGDRIHLQGTLFPTDLDLTIRAIYRADPPRNALYFNSKYLDESVIWFKGQAGWYTAQIDSTDHVSRVAEQIDTMFHNAPFPTKTETERAFQIDYISSLGNLKAFILSICGAVVFSIMLVSASTMAMAVRSRTREVAMLRSLGFTRKHIIFFLVGESAILATIGGIVGVVMAIPLSAALTRGAQNGGIWLNIRVSPLITLMSISVAVVLGLVSGYLPAYRASRIDIVEGLRHIG